MSSTNHVTIREQPCKERLQFDSDSDIWNAAFIVFFNVVTRRGRADPRLCRSATTIATRSSNIRHSSHRPSRHRSTLRKMFDTGFAGWNGFAAEETAAPLQKG